VASVEHLGGKDEEKGHDVAGPGEGGASEEGQA